MLSHLAAEQSFLSPGHPSDGLNFALLGDPLGRRGTQQISSTLTQAWLSPFAVRLRRVRNPVSPPTVGVLHKRHPKVPFPLLSVIHPGSGGMPRLCRAGWAPLPPWLQLSLPAWKCLKEWLCVEDAQDPGVEVPRSPGS